MNENIKLGAKIGGQSLAKWATIFVLGNVVSIVCFLIVMYKNIGLAGGGHGSLWALLVGLLATNFCGFLLFAGLPVFITLYFLLANKTAVQQAVYLAWKNKAGTYITEKVEHLIAKLTDKDGKVNNISSATMLKAKVLQENKNDKSSPKWQRLVINYGFKKIKLDDIDFGSTDLKLSSVLATKFHEFIAHFSKPSMKWFWVLAGSQILLLFCSLR